MLDPGSIPIKKIPNRFYSDGTGEPFSNCINCDRYLLNGGIPYVIEKAIKKYHQFNTEDTIFEHAMCIDCQIKLRETLSEESKKNIDNFIASRVDFEKRRTKLIDTHGPELDEWLKKCIVTGNPVAEESEYQVYCQCDGENLYYAYMPFMLSGRAMEEIQELLSAQTRDEIDRFMGEFFGLPPELRPADHPLVLF